MQLSEDALRAVIRRKLDEYLAKEAGGCWTEGEHCDAGEPPHCQCRAKLDGFSTGITEAVMRAEAEARAAAIPSPDDIIAGLTPAGGWTKKTLAGWGVPWPPPKGWRKDLERRWHQQQAALASARRATAAQDI